jgi:membrane protein DedA with SNARE-associated domain/rhodanese-related sulfurtransferase
VLETLHFLAQHGYWLLAGAVLGRQACLPIPANLFLVAAGALARSGRISLSESVGLSVATFLFADFLWYCAGRRFGDRMLHFACGLSSDTGSCVDRATGSFSRHGVRILLVSKFIIGLDAVAAPLAGASAIPAVQFLLFDALGALLWTTVYASLGYVFSEQLDLVATHVARIGIVLALAGAAVFGFYAARRLARWQTFLHQFKLSRITPEQLRGKLKLGENILVVDLQGHPKDGTGALAIPGAVRINPRRLELYKDVEIAPSQEVVLYCECPGELTSARVALALQRRGIEHVRPLAGGLQAWRDLGFPVTSTVRVLPIPSSSGRL